MPIRVAAAEGRLYRATRLRHTTLGHRSSATTLVSPHQVVIKRALLDGFGRRGVIRTSPNRVRVAGDDAVGGPPAAVSQALPPKAHAVAARQMWFKLLCAKDSTIKHDFSQHMLSTLKCADLPAPKLRRGRYPQEQVC